MEDRPGGDGSASRRGADHAPRGRATSVQLTAQLMQRLRGVHGALELPKRDGLVELPPLYLPVKRPATWWNAAKVPTPARVTGRYGSDRATIGAPPLHLGAVARALLQGRNINIPEHMVALRKAPRLRERGALQPCVP